MIGSPNSYKAFQANATKKRMRYLYECIAFSFLVAAITHELATAKVDWLQSGINMLSSITGNPVSSDFGVRRAFAYFVISYLTIVPVYFFRTMIMMWGTRVVKQFTLIKKIILTFIILIIMPVVFVFPFYFLTVGSNHYWRTKVTYDLVVGSYLGLSLLGGAMLWVAVLCLMAIFGLIPLIWINHPTKETENEHHRLNE